MLHRLSLVNRPIRICEHMKFIDQTCDTFENVLERRSKKFFFTLCDGLNDVAKSPGET